MDEVEVELTFRERLGRFIFPKQWELGDQLDQIAADLNDLTPRLEALLAPKPELTAGDMLTRSKERQQVPIRIQRKPFREVKALAEKTLDPHYQEHQQRIRNEEAKQPRSR